MRYVLLNPVRAGLVAQAGDWPWSSLHYPILLDPAPVPTPRHWDNVLAQPMTEAELDALRTSVTRQAPFGDPQWQRRVAKRPGIHPLPALATGVEKVACPLILSIPRNASR
jgi:putative transposase